MKKILILLLCSVTMLVSAQSFSYDNPLMGGSGREIPIDGTIVNDPYIQYQQYSQLAIDNRGNNWQQGGGHEANHTYTCPICHKTFYWNDYKGRLKDGIQWSGNGQGTYTCWYWIGWIPTHHPCNQLPLGSPLILLLLAAAYKVHRKR